MSKEKFDIRYKKDSLWIITNCFYLHIRKLGYEDIENLIELRDLLLNYSFYFGLYPEYGFSDKKVMKFLSMIIKLFEGDCILSPNGDIVLVREKGEIIVEIDERYPEKCFFELLELPYKEGDIGKYIFN